MKIAPLVITFILGSCLDFNNYKYEKSPFENKIDIKASFLEDGYIFNLYIDTKQETINNILVTFCNVTLIDIPKTNNKMVTFTLERSRGLLEYKGYKEMIVNVTLEDEFLSDKLDILGVYDYDSKIVDSKASLNYIIYNDVPILKDEFEIVEESGAIFPVELKFKMENFISLYIAKDMIDNMNFKLEFDDYKIELEPKFDRVLEKYNLCSSEIKFTISPGLYKSKLVFSYKRLFDIDFIYNYDIYFKKVIGTDENSPYELIFGEL